MEVYIEMIYLLSFFICIISLECTYFLLNSPIQKKQVLLVSLFFSFHILVLYLDIFIPFLYWFLLFVGVYKKQVFLYFLVFLLVYLSLIYFMQSLLSYSSVYKGVLLISTNSHILQCFLLIVVLGILEVFLLIYSKRKVSFKQYYYDFEIINQGICCRGCAFFDSGNDLYYDGYPVVLINKNCFPAYQKITSLQTNGVVNKTIDIVQIEQMNINKQSMKNIYIGIIENIEYDGLLHKQLMGGVL